MTRDKWQEEQSKKNWKAFVELGNRIAAGELSIMDIRIDTEQFGHSRVVLFVKEKEE